MMSAVASRRCGRSKRPPTGRTVRVVAADACFDIPISRSLSLPHDPVSPQSFHRTNGRYIADIRWPARSHRMLQARLLCVSIVLGVLLLGARAFAQERTGTITGTVSDAGHYV